MVDAHLLFAVYLASLESSYFPGHHKYTQQKLLPHKINNEAPKPT